MEHLAENVGNLRMCAQNSRKLLYEIAGDHCQDFENADVAAEVESWAVAQ